MIGGIATYVGRVRGDTFEELDVALNTALQKLWPDDGEVTILKFDIQLNVFAGSIYVADFLVRHEG